MRFKPLAIILIFLGLVTLVFAQDAVMPTATPRPHGPMELFGIGPELFQDRAVAWIKALAATLNELVASVGIIAIAVILMLKNVKNTDLQSRVDRVDARVMENTKQIGEVALAVPPVDTGPKEVIVTNPVSAPANVAEVKKDA